MGLPARFATQTLGGGKKNQEVQLGYRDIVNFFFELGMLEKTPRSGFQFLGSGRQSVAEHSFRVAMIGFALARLDPKVDAFKVVCMCLLHDVAEARTGDQNYVNKRYVAVDEASAIGDMATPLPFGDEFKELLKEYRDSKTPEAALVHDADQLELILELKEQNDLGNSYAVKWIYFARQRLVTSTAKKIAEEILSTDSTDWWFKGHDEWWGKAGKGEQ
ncbi:Metal dependent phosphohydrolase [Syntrophobacter sp. SbD1]|nr:Metal dependent phosphohydrolase [Syntrophobacter sp. SbD1]